jgi:hypothetical protein
MNPGLQVFRACLARKMLTSLWSWDLWSEILKVGNVCCEVYVVDLNFADIFELLLVNMSRQTRNTESHQSSKCVGINLLFYDSQFNSIKHNELIKKLTLHFEKVISVSRIFISEFLLLTYRCYTNVWLLDCLRM